MAFGDMTLAEGAQGTLIGCVGFACVAEGRGDLEVGQEIVVLEGKAIGGCVEDGEGEVFDADIEC